MKLKMIRRAPPLGDDCLRPAQGVMALGGAVPAILASGVAAVLLAACHSSSARTETAAGPKPVASIQEIMLQQVDPTADRLWDSVGEKIDASGYHKLAPKTDAEWTALRQDALRLAELPNLLVVAGRPVAVQGGKAADEGSPGVLTTAQIQAQIAKDPARLRVAAAQLQTEALGMVAAIDARDPERLSDAGEKVDSACESCHLQFWYPPDAAPKSAPKVYSGSKS